MSNLIRRYEAVEEEIELRLAENGSMSHRYVFDLEKLLIRIHEIATEDLPTWNSYELATKLELIRYLTAPYVQGIEESVEEHEDG